KEGFKRNLFLRQVLTGQNFEWDEKVYKDVPGLYDAALDNFYTQDLDTGKKTYVFKPDGTFDTGGYLTFINFYNKPVPEKSNLDFVRDLVRLSIAEKVGLETGLAEGEELEARRLEYEANVAEFGEEEAKNIYARTVSAT